MESLLSNCQDAGIIKEEGINGGRARTLERFAPELTTDLPASKVRLTAPCSASSGSLTRNK